MAKTAELVTVADVADALGLPGQVDVIAEGLRGDGITILEDWAGRPAVAFEDAKRTVDRHRKAQAEWEERQMRVYLEEDERRKCQREFDLTVAWVVQLLRDRNPFAVNYADDQARAVQARRLAVDALKHKHAAHAIGSLQIRPIQYVDPAQVRNEGPLSGLEPDVREHILSALGI